MQTNQQTEAEMDATERLFNRANKCGNAVGAILQQRARESAKRSKRKAEENGVRAEMDIRTAANDICNTGYGQEKITLTQIMRSRDTLSPMYRDAVANFLSQAENVGAVVLTGDEIFIADYDLLLASLGRYLS